MFWNNGQLAEIKMGQDKADYSFSISSDVFSALCLGHKTWQELQNIRPDIFRSSYDSAVLIDVLFPTTKSWIHEQY